VDKFQHAVTIRPSRIAGILAGTALSFVALSLTGQYLRLFPNSYQISDPTAEFFLDLFIQKFDVNGEVNIPTYFNTLILVILAGLAFVIASAKRSQKDRYRNEWLLMAMVFLFMSIDEAAVIHEKFNVLLKNMPNVDGLFTYKWVIGGIFVVLVLALMFLRFFLQLDNRNKTFFFLSSAIYLTGALGSEMFSGRYQAIHGTKNFTYSAMTTFEESFEWFGITLMIFTLLKYIENYYSEISFRSTGALPKPVKPEK